MGRKESLVVVKDVIEELCEENKRLFNELKFADKCLNKLIELKTKLVFHSNKIKTNSLKKTEWFTIENLIKEVNKIIGKSDLKSIKSYESIETPNKRSFITCEEVDQNIDKKTIESDDNDSEIYDNTYDNDFSGEESMDCKTDIEAENETNEAVDEDEESDDNGSQTDEDTIDYSCSGEELIDCENTIKSEDKPKKFVEKGIKSKNDLRLVMTLMIIIS